MTDDPEVEVPAEGEAIENEGSGNEAEAQVQTARIIVKRSGAETDISFEICATSTIGRFDPAVGPIDVDLKDLPEGQYVSRKHARISCVDGVWKIEDLGSSNGTFLLRDDFERVDEAELYDGAEFALGNARFLFKTGEQDVGV